MKQTKQIMDNEKAKYIIRYFSHLLTGVENMAIRHTHSTYKLNNSTSENSNLTRIYKEKGWLTTEQNVLDLLKDGYEQFELNSANRILSQNPEKVFLNNCPKCEKLARTPYARQCRYCGHSWHNLTVAQFQIKGSVQIKGRHFFLLGQIVKGEIKQEQYMDLTILGLNKKPKIEAIEFSLQRQGDKVWEDVGLGTHELTEDEKEFIKNKGDFAIPIDIIQER